MSVRVTLVRMGPTAPTVSIATPAPAHRASVVLTVRSTPMTALTGSIPCYLTQLLYNQLKSEHSDLRICFPLYFDSSCFNGGTCVDGINAFTCLCLTGFTGSYCQYDINECDSKPCLNGGTCLDGYGTYKCTCPHGYTGVNCQVGDLSNHIAHCI